MLYPLSYEGKYGFSSSQTEDLCSQHNLSTTFQSNFTAFLDCSPLFKHAYATRGSNSTMPRAIHQAVPIAQSNERWEEMTGRLLKVTVSRPNEFPDRKRPYVVRWRVNGRAHWRSFASLKGRNGAESFCSMLDVAAVNESAWNAQTGLPKSMSTTKSVSVATFCQTYIRDEWTRLSPSSRKSYVEALASFVLSCARANASEPPYEWRREVRHWLTPNSCNQTDDSITHRIENQGQLTPRLRTWLAKNSPLLSELDREILFEADRKMRSRPRGGALYAPNTQRRLTTVAKTALGSAVDRGLLDTIPWPRRDRGATAKSDFRGSQEMDSGVVPDIATLLQILDALETQQPGSHLYRILSYVCGFSGLRPGEAIALTVEDLRLPEVGWGSIRVQRAWSGVIGGMWNDDSENIGEPKTERSRRVVPIPSLLVAELRNWLARTEIQSGPLFMTRNGTRPTQSNWRRALFRAGSDVAWPHTLTPYGLRRTNASHLAQSIPIAEAADRLGHSVEVLTKHYVKRVAGQTEISNQILERFYEVGTQSSARSSIHRSSSARRIRS